MTTTPAFTRRTTIAVVMAQILTELGLAVPATFVTSSDQNTVQILSYLTAAGQDLCLATDWEWLHKEFTITADGVTTTYDLPTDFAGFVSGAFWNNTSRLPVIGPLTTQIWRLLKARLLGGNTISVQYRIINNKVEFYAAPASGQVLITDYYSRGWILQADGVTYRDNPQGDDDTVLFDPRLIIPLTKLRWREGKRFDTTAAKQEFENAWDLVLGRDIPGPTLSVSPSMHYPYLGYLNIPDTNYGP